MELKLYYTYTDEEIVKIFHPILEADMNDLTLCQDINRLQIIRRPDVYIHNKIQPVFNHSGQILATFFLTGVQNKDNPDRFSGMWECVYIHDNLKGENNG